MPSKPKTASKTPSADTPVDTAAYEGPPGVFKRIAVIVCDAFLLFAVLFVATLIPAYFISPESFVANPATDSVVHELDIPLQGWIYRIYLLLLIIIFYRDIRLVLLELFNFCPPQ